jgi:hypothetical protein
MTKKMGRPQAKNRQELIVRARIRVDNDPLLQQFAELIATVPNASDIVRDALRLYVLYQNGEMTMPDALEDGAVLVEVEVDALDQINAEELFGF